MKFQFDTTLERDIDLLIMESLIGSMKLKITRSRSI